MNLSRDKDELKVLSEIAISIGQVFFASTVVPFVFSIDKMRPTVLLSGIVLSCGSWILSFLLIRRRKDDRHK